MFSVNVYVPKDRVTNLHQGYGFVEFRGEEDADYVSVRHRCMCYEFCILLSVHFYCLLFCSTVKLFILISFPLS